MGMANLFRRTISIKMRKIIFFIGWLLLLGVNIYAYRVFEDFGIVILFQLIYYSFFYYNFEFLFVNQAKNDK